MFFLINNSPRPRNNLVVYFVWLQFVVCTSHVTSLGVAASCSYTNLAAMAAAATTTISVAPDSWKDATITEIKLAQTVIDRTQTDVENARRSDPLPRLREACVRESNQRIHEYARATRAVVIRLQQSLVATNEEIKSMLRVRQGLERGLENLRKDLVLNAETIALRKERPKREKVKTTYTQATKIPQHLYYSNFIIQ